MNMMTLWRKNDHQFLPLGLDEQFERECKDAFAVPPNPVLSPVDRLHLGMNGILNTLRGRDADFDKEIDELETRLRETREDKATNLAQIARIERSYAALSEQPAGDKHMPSKKPAKGAKAEAGVA